MSEERDPRPPAEKRPAAVALAGAEESPAKRPRYGPENLPRPKHPEDVMDWAKVDLDMPDDDASKLLKNKIDIEELQIWSRDLDKAKKEMVQLYEISGKWAGKVVEGIAHLIPTAAPKSEILHLEETINLTAFWRHALANPLPAPNTTIQTFVITDWDSLSTLQPFFIRQCYPQLFEKIFSQISARQSDPHGKAIRGVIQTGNPGVGKTFSLTYDLWALGQRKQTVYFESERLEYGWLLSPDGSVVGFRFHEMPAELVSNTNLVYLFDASAKTIGGPCTEITGYTILATSPKKEHYSEFRKTVKENRMYMPVWTEDEVAKFAADTIHDVQTRESVLSWYDRFGGIARYVFSDQENFADRLENAIKTADVNRIKLSLGGLDALEDVSHLLVHYDVDESFKSISMKFASKYVEDAVFQRVVQSQRQALLDFVFVGAVGVAAVAGIRGTWFEHFAHERLARGGTFRVRPLVPDAAVEQWQLPSLTLRLNSFKKIEEINVAMGIYTTPARKNFAALDGFCQYDAGFIVGVQMTVSKKHPTVSAEFAKMLEQLIYTGKPNATDRKFRLVFVVPPDVFDEYKSPQKFLGVDGKELVQLPLVITKNCQQFVLEVSMS